MSTHRHLFIATHILGYRALMNQKLWAATDVPLQPTNPTEIAAINQVVSVPFLRCKTELK